ncbi:hypothetical protein [Pseudomonas vranovensis]|uniref:hypothetical protein n=1 Tax=Pseudomonas vranovensis TaxID=321661 RepID=UPI003D96351A
MPASIKLEPVVELVGAEGTTYYPMKHQQGNAATVKVCYDGFEVSDTINVYWQTVEDEYERIEPWVEHESCALFQVSYDLLALRITGKVRIYCEVVREEERFTSPVVEYRLELRREDYPPTTVLEMTADGRLDLSRLCGKNPHVYIAPWPYIKEGQEVVALTLLGANARFSWFEGDLITAADVSNGWLRELPLDKLQQFGHGRPVHMDFIIRLNPSLSGAQHFPFVNFTVLTESHLTLLPPVVPESTDCGSGHYVLNPVNALQGATLQVTYENMCCNDRVCATWQGTPGAGTPELECQLVDDSGIVSLHIPPQAISANFNGEVSAAYTVWREGRAWASPPLVVQILDISVLPTPAVEQSTGQWLDLNTFTGDAIATVEPWDFAAVGQACWLTVTGQLESGGEYAFQVLEGLPLTAEWLANGVNMLLVRDKLEQLADYSDVQLHFAVNFDGKVDRSTAREFPLLSLQVLQEDLQLPAPQVTQAVGNTLTVYNGRDGVTLRVRYERMSADHSIQPCWRRVDGSCLPIAAKPGNPALGYVDFIVPREAVIMASGKTVEINYTVTYRGGQKSQVSSRLGLIITKPVRLPTPVVPQATLGILDLRNFYGDAGVSVEKWWFILPGQRVWLRGQGTRQDGSAYSFHIFIAHSVTAGEVSQGLKVLLPRGVLSVLKHGSTLTFTCTVTADGSMQQGGAVVCPSLTVTVQSLFDDLTDFQNGTWNGWVWGGAGVPNDLSIGKEGAGLMLINTTSTSNSAGVFLKKVFNGLEVRRRYLFSIDVRQFNNASPAPQISVVAGSVPIIEPNNISGMVWRKLSGSFTATSTSMEVALYNHLATGIGNDLAMDNLRLSSL